jgi:hypothetical protein
MFEIQNPLRVLRAVSNNQTVDEVLKSYSTQFDNIQAYRPGNVSFYMVSQSRSDSLSKLS